MYYYKAIEDKSGFWLVEPKYDWRYLNKTESVFTTENGYMGIRATQEFRGLKDKPGMFVAGVFSKSSPKEVTELVNCPDVIPCEVIIDGQILSLDTGNVSCYERRYNLKTAEVMMSCHLELENGLELEIKTRRFASFHNRHMFCQQIEITPVNRDVECVKIKAGINGQITNSGASHFRETECKVYDKRYMHFIGITDYTKVDIYEDVNVLSGTITDENFGLERRSIYRNIAGTVSKGEKLVIQKTVLVYTVEDRERLSEPDKTDSIRRLSGGSYESHLALHADAAEKFWECADIEIDGISLEDRAAVKYALLQLYGMTPVGTSKSSIGAKGLSGEGYKGHVFWDTEIYMLPFYCYTNPEIARDLLLYRYHGLEGAREKAKEYGYEGAMYPWESAADGREETPLFAALNIHTGKANPVWSGRKEHHVSADIAYAILKYEQMTGDMDFMMKYGLEMLIEISKFWSSRAVEKNGRLEILDIIGPDEYSEHIDNNAYTNYMAKYVIENTYKKLRKMKNESCKEYQTLNRKLDLDRWMGRFEQFIEKIYLPQPDEDGIIPQDDTILSKPEVPNIEEFKKSQIKQAILLKYSRDEVVDMKALKQADLVMLLNLFPHLFDEETIKKNVVYYEKRTLHDSSLSYCAHAQACANIGALDLSLEFFEKALEVDLVDNPYDSTDGLHSASLGGIWNCIIQGYAGVNVSEEGVEIHPHLPDAWKSICFCICIKGEYYRVKITDKDVEMIPMHVKEEKAG
ncbi:MAG: glycoside hydrolase family 65 protein [Eubacteriales bacterium]|nr:glycoside hydrolase family 65 protein [Eubacteriales bacterium]